MNIEETLPPFGACVRVHVERAYAFDKELGIWLRRQVEEDEVAHNLVTNTGRVQLHTQGYGTTMLLTNGFNYIALTNDSVAPAATDATLASEITTNGLGRTQGTVVLASGSGNQTTVSNTFTYTGTSAQVQKTALFTASASGVMNHEIAFTQRTLYTNDTLLLTFTITMG